MRGSAQGNRARSTMRMGARDVGEIIKDVLQNKEEEKNAPKDKNQFYKYNYYKNDLSYLEP